MQAQDATQKPPTRFGPSRLGDRTRGVVATLLVVVAAALLLVGILTVYGRSAVFDADDFSDRAARTLEDENVRSVIAERFVNQIVEGASAELITARPLIEGVVSEMIGTGAFQAIFREAASNANRVLFTKDQDVVALDLVDGMIVITGALQRIDPSIAKEIPPNLQAGLIEVSDRTYAADLVDVAEDVRLLAVVAPSLALVLFALAVWVSADRRRTVTTLGISVAVVGALVLLAHDIARSIVLGDVKDETSERAVGTVWDAFLADLRTSSLALGGFGLVLAAAAASILRPIDLNAHVDRLRRLATYTPTSGPGRLARAVLFIAVGLFVILEREHLIQIALLAVGLYALFYGLSEILRLTVRPPAPEPTEGAVPRRHLPRRPRSVAVAALVLGAAAVGALVLVTGGGSSGDRDRAITGCNGHTELCDRRLDEVAFAATHNSMSAASERGWFFASHDGGIRAQLDFGVRALLIDTWYGVPDGGEVRTDLSAYDNERALVVEELGQGVVAAAERLGGRLGVGASDGKRQTYLCHGLCEIGVTGLATGLADIREFLEENPREVLIIFIQDTISPKDTEKAFDESGLIDFVYTHTPGAKLPTLREMIRRGERVLVMAEEDASGVDWYQQGFELTQETPFKFESPEEFSCKLNRGERTSPLFLLNHWIEKATPAPGDADKVNAFDFLLERARRCEKQRGMLPNLVAVNFYDRGRVLEVVDELNGFSRSESGRREQ